MKKVMVFGTFDYLHEGHINYFKQAKKCGDYLVVVVSRDSTAEKLKDRKPHYSEKKRLKEVSKVDVVDKAVPGNEGDDLLRIVIEERPAVVCLGYDQKVDEKELAQNLRARGLKNVEVKRMKSYKPEVYKSTKLKEQLK